uniref:Uncharacterized protein n=1 Tax=Globodera rostochiensis TaxID=31243 RepID=A0A914GW00_GLORO
MHTVSIKIDCGPRNTKAVATRFCVLLLGLHTKHPSIWKERTIGSVAVNQSMFLVNVNEAQKRKEKKQTTTEKRVTTPQGRRVCVQPTNSFIEFGGMFSRKINHDKKCPFPPVTRP